MTLLFCIAMFAASVVAADCVHEYETWLLDIEEMP